MRELKKDGYTAKELRAAGFDLWDLISADYTPLDLKTAGFTAEELKYEHYSAFELKDAGFTINELKDAGFSTWDYCKILPKVDYGDSGALNDYSVSSRIVRIFTLEEMLDAGYSISDVRLGGKFTARDFREAGITAEQLAGPYKFTRQFDATDLKFAGYTAKELKRAGFTLYELYAARYGLRELKSAGFTFLEMEQVMEIPSWKKLREAGFTVKDIREAYPYMNYQSMNSELKKAGFTDEEIHKR